MRKIKYILIMAVIGLFFTTTATAKEDNPYMEPVLFEATAYCYGNLTKTETVPLEGRTIAVDPDVIPLGSTVIVYTENMDMLGIYQAEDTGSKIKNRVIDIYMENRENCMNWGRRNVYVQIVNADG